MNAPVRRAFVTGPLSGRVVALDLPRPRIVTSLRMRLAALAQRVADLDPGDAERLVTCWEDQLSQYATDAERQAHHER